MHLLLLPYLKQENVTTYILSINLLARSFGGRTQEGLCQEGEGWEANSHSKPKVQSVGYGHSCSHCSFAAPGSDPLVTKEEKLPSLVTSWGT